MSPTVLHPRLGRRIFLFVAPLLLIVVAVGAITSGAWYLGAPLLLYCLLVLPFAIGRLFAPKAYTTELDETGFRVHDSFGRVAHDVRWSDVKALGEIPGN